MKRLLVIVLGIVVLSLFSGTIYYLWSKSEEVPETFQTESPEIRTVTDKAVATGSVLPRTEVEIKPQVSGIVEELHVEPGQRVRAGDLIARIRIIPNMVNLSNAENRLNRARISMENAELELRRNRSLREDGVISDTAFKQVELAYANAATELGAATDNLELIRKGTRRNDAGETNTLVRATIDGMVLEVPLEEGDSVIEANTFNDGTTIATIADMDQLIFDGKVDESEVGKIRPGMQLLLTIGAIEGRTFDAVLEHIAPKGVEENGAIQFEIRAALKLREDAFIRANYSANADIVLDRRDDVLTINEALLQFEEEKPFVEVEVAPQTFERRDVEVGLSDGIYIEVVTGLQSEDRIKVVR